MLVAQEVAKSRSYVLKLFYAVSATAASSYLNAFSTAKVMVFIVTGKKITCYLLLKDYFFARVI